MNQDYGVNVATDSNISIPLSFAFDMATDTHRKMAWSRSK